MNVEINGRAYRIEFSYRRSAERIGKPKTMGGVSACAIVGDGSAFDSPSRQSDNDPPRFIALGAVVCGSADRWVRRDARMRAFYRCVMDCGLLKFDRLAFFNWFRWRWPEPAKQERKARFKPTQEEIERRRKAARAMKAGRA